MKTRWQQLLVVACGAVLVVGCLTISIVEYVEMHMQGTAGLVFLGGEQRGKDSPPQTGWILPGTVFMVVPGGPGEKSGVLPGDLILSVNSMALSETEQLKALSISTRRGDVLFYRVRRGDREYTLPVRVDSLFVSTGWLVKAGTQCTVGLVFLFVGWLVFLKKPGDRRAVVFFWMCLISGIVYIDLPAYNSLFSINRLGWQTLSAHNLRHILFSIPVVLMGSFLVPLILHLALIFPKDHRMVRKYPAVIHWVYWLPLFGLTGLMASIALIAFGLNSGWNAALPLLLLTLVMVVAGLIAFQRIKYPHNGQRIGWKVWCVNHPFLTLTLFYAGLFLIQLVLEAVLLRTGLSNAGRITVTLLSLLAPTVLLLLSSLGYPLVTCLALFTSYSESGAEEKRQLKWPLWGIVVSLGGKFLLAFFVLGFVAVSGMKVFMGAPMIAAQEIAGALLAALIPLSFAIAILKYRLMEIDLIIKRTVLYSLLTGIIVALYFGLVGGLGGLLVRFTGMKGEYVAILSTVLVAAAFLPIRTRVQDMVDRRFFRKRLDYPQLLKKLREQMQEAATLNGLLVLVVDTAQQALMTRAVAFFLADDAGVFRVAAKIGLPDAALTGLSFSPTSQRVLKVDGVRELEELNWPDQDLAPARAAGSKFIAAVRFKGQLMGILSVGTKLSGEGYDTEDREFLALLAEQAAAGIDNHRLREQEGDLERGREIQEALLPKHVPQAPGYSIAGAWQPARTVSGDYYDVFPLSPEKLALCIADVAGKGLPAALLMSNLQAAVKSTAVDGVEPKKLCENVNRVICGNVGADQFITFVFCVLDIATKRLIYTNAGHNPPLMVRGDGSVARLHEGGPVLGVIKNSSYGQGEVQLATGDRLLLFTDGVSEAANANQEEFGEDRLTALLRTGPGESAESLQSQVMQEVALFCAHRFQDDATVLALVVK